MLWYYEIQSEKALDKTMNLKINKIHFKKITNNWRERETMQEKKSKQIFEEF